MRFTVGIVHGGPEGPKGRAGAEILKIRQELGDGDMSEPEIHLVYVLAGSMMAPDFTGIKAGKPAVQQRRVTVRIAVGHEVLASADLEAELRRLTMEAIEVGRERLRAGGVMSGDSAASDLSADDEAGLSRPSELVTQISFAGIDFDECVRFEDLLTDRIGGSNGIEVLGHEYGGLECAVFVQTNEESDRRLLVQVVTDLVVAQFAPNAVTMLDDDIVISLAESGS